MKAGGGMLACGEASRKTDHDAGCFLAAQYTLRTMQPVCSPPKNSDKHGSKS